MKILSRPPKKEFPIVTCNHCNTRAQIESHEELKYVSDGDYFTWTCPTCKYVGGISAKLVPKKYEI